MYTAFHGLREKPFALSPDPRFLFLAESHREALAHLLYGIEQGEGFIVITGEVGTGKTTLCRTLLGRLGADTEVAFVFNPRLSARELLQSIHAELGLSGAGESWRELVDELNRFLVAKRGEGRRVLLVIDEAQQLEDETLEQIRLLSNFETETAKLIQIVLLGQPELDAKLSRPELRQLRQRITVYWTLAPLTTEETAAYVRHRLRIAAGVERPIFTPAAERDVRRRSGGIPRVVNVICDRALLAAYAAGQREVGPALVAQAARELGLEASVARGGRLRDRARRWLAAPGARVAAIAAIALAVLGLGVGIGARLFDERASRRGEHGVAAAARETPQAGALDAAAASARTAAVSAAPPGGVPAAKEPSPAISGGSTPVVAPAPDGAAAPPAGAAGTGTTAIVPEALSASTPSADATHAGNPGPASAPPAESEPAPHDALAAALDATPPGVVTAHAVDAALAAWGEAPLGAASLGVADALAACSTRGFSLLALTGARLEQLASLGYPAFVVLPAGDGVGRLGWLRSVGPTQVVLEGIAAAPLAIDAPAFVKHWSGEVFVPWRDLASLPETLKPGASGEAVAWLQRALGELGFTAVAPTGELDLQTHAAVLAFQQSHGLAADGAVGPRTKMALYRALGRPGLPAPIAAGASASR